MRFLKQLNIMLIKPLENRIIEALEDIKAIDIVQCNVRELTPLTDTMIICSGNSQRHTAAIADKIIEIAKKNKALPLGVEGKERGEWILIDLNDLIVHIMLPATREFYQLESLWSTGTATVA